MAEEQTKQTLLVVCTGNTCRSPMAAAVLNAYLEKYVPRPQHPPA